MKYASHLNKNTIEGEYTCLNDRVQILNMLYVFQLQVYFEVVVERITKRFAILCNVSTYLDFFIGQSTLYY